MGEASVSKNLGSMLDQIKLETSGWQLAIDFYLLLQDILKLVPKSRVQETEGGLSVQLILQLVPKSRA